VVRYGVVWCGVAMCGDLWCAVVCCGVDYGVRYRNVPSAKLVKVCSRSVTVGEVIYATAIAKD
jgi:hypothetical protein